MPLGAFLISPGGFDLASKRLTACRMRGSSGVKKVARILKSLVFEILES